MRNMTWVGPHDIRAGRVLDEGAMDITPGRGLIDTDTFLEKLGLDPTATLNSTPAWSSKKTKSKALLFGPGAESQQFLAKLNGMATGEDGDTSTFGLPGMPGRKFGGVTGSSGGKSVTFGTKDDTPSVSNLAFGSKGMSAW